ncbi:putative aldo keto [Mycena sanguinolenta]|uniref:Putative aldo keto n=1 Tax=Mycena sanguinolenta TaxID=230812 RepID=A0A8H6XRX4_9AGAR|nr:putative aldo keto [Mycena sanguinolenta]
MGFALYLFQMSYPSARSDRPSCPRHPNTVSSNLSPVFDSADCFLGTSILHIKRFIREISCTFMAPPELIFGTANVGSVWTAPEDLSTLTHELSEGGIRRLDTAARYPPTNPGASQRTLGAHSFGSQGFAIDTKVLAWTADGSGEMTPEAIEKSVMDSLEALKIEKINVLYSHRPDPSTPLATQLEGVDAQFKLGRFREFGVSNWPQTAIASYIELAKKSGAVQPTAAQYQYNLLARHAEKEFFPFLRSHGIRFVAFSPLAGGFLTGKDSTWKQDIPFAAGYRHWYIQPGMFAAVEKFTALCTEYSVPLPEAAMRWLAYHSALRETDAILVGATKVEQVREAVRALNAGPLPAGLVEGMDSVFDLCKDEAKKLVTF